MRATMLKFRALGLFTMMALALFSCSDDDNDASTSFLEKHGGTVWKFEEPVSGAAIFAQINNSEANPFEIWISFGEDTCFIYESIMDAGNTEVLENNENKVVIRIDEGPSEYSILQLSVSGNVLAVNSKFYEDGQLEDDETFVLQKTSDNPDDLVLCGF